MKIFAFSLIAILLTFQLNYSDAATIKCNCADDTASTSKQSQQITKEKTSASSSSAAALNENIGNSDGEATSQLTTEIPTRVASNATEASDVKKFIQRVQNTLEKAKPWVDEIEKEAKRLEQTAKRFGEDVIHRLGDLMDRIIGSEGAAGSSGGSFLSTIIGGAAAGAGGTTTEAVGDEGAAVIEVTENVAPSNTIHANTATHNHVADKNNNENVVTTNLNAAANAAHAAANAAQAAAAIIDETIENEIINDDGGKMQQELQMCPDGFVVDVNDICQRLDY